MTLREILREKITNIVTSLAGSTGVPDFSVDPPAGGPKSAEHGDYAANVALLLAKSLGRKPIEVAEELAKKLADERWEVSVAPPGFLNFKLTDRVLVDALLEVVAKGELWGTSEAGNGKTVMVEYFQLNIAKRPHIGHVRSAVIGDVLKRIFLSQGYRAVSDTHVGDWGTQFGILLWAFKTLVREEDRHMYEERPFENLEKLYEAANLQILQKPELRELGKEEFVKLERGDKENREIWEWMVEVSMKKLKESTERLGLLKFDEHKGESSYEKDMPKIVEDALEKGIADHKEDGAILVDLTKEKLDEAVLIKSDGASTYLLRDLATIKYRKEHWQFWKNIYVVDVRQSHHFKQLFRVAELLGYEGVGDSEHVEFGFMKLPEGAISTRKGTAIALDKLLDEAERRAAAVIREKNPELANADHVAKMVGIGAIKYFDLSHNRKSDVVFEWERALSFEGNTGPYLQYAHARLKSILRKIDVTISSGQNSPFEKGGVRGISKDNKSLLTSLFQREEYMYSLSSVEHRLISLTLRYPMILENALMERSPHILAAYLYEFASMANEFYHALPVLQEEDEHKRALRVILVTTSATTLQNGLNLLGIEAPEEM